MTSVTYQDIMNARLALGEVPGLADTTRRVAFKIIGHFNLKTGQCDPGLERLASLLGLPEKTVRRATKALDECGLIEKSSHGGKSHRASYRPNWELLRAIAADIEASMKSGDIPASESAYWCASETDANRTSVSGSTGHGCPVKPDMGVHQTNRRNYLKELSGAEPVETRGDKQGVEPVQAKPRSAMKSPEEKGLSRGSKPEAQRSLLLPITGGATVSHGKAARAAAERRLYTQLHALGQSAEASVLEWITGERLEAATEAEIHRRGGGLAFVQEAMLGQLSVRQQAGAASAGACHGSFLGVG